MWRVLGSHPVVARVVPRPAAHLAEVAWMVPLGGLALVVGLLWFFSVPFHGGPDEAAHFDVARFIHDHRRLPLFSPGEMWLYRTEVGAVESYAAFPPLAYILGAALLPLFDGRFWGARVVSLICYVGTVLMTFAIARKLAPRDRSTALCAALVVALLPQVSFTGSYFNNDALALFEVSVLIYLLLELWDSPRLGLAVATGFVIGALLLTKYPFYGVAGVGLLAGLHACRQGQILVSRVALVLSCLLTCGWWFLRNWQLYGEPIPGRVVEAAKEAAGGNALFVAADHGINLLTVSFATEFWPLTLKSFVATFGFQTIFLDPGYYAACLFATLLALAGAVRGIMSEGLDGRARAVAAVGGAMLLATIASAMAISVYGEWSPQGRYLFPALIPVAIGLVAGWRALGPNGRCGRWLPWVPIGGLVALNGISLGAWVVPTYFGPHPQHIILQVDSPARTEDVRRAVTITGWSLLEAASSWQPLSPDSIVGYRRPVDSVLISEGGPPGAGTTLGTARYGVRRPDVRDFYGRARHLERVGFEFVAPAGALRPGRHLLYVCAYAAGEPGPACKERSIEVS